jgi:hypothetical protein
MSELVLFGAFPDIPGRAARVLMYFDFCRSRVRVDGVAFRVMNFHIPRRWALFGSPDCQAWAPICRRRALLAPAMNSFVACQCELSQPYRYLMLKIYKKRVLLQKLDFFGVLESETAGGVSDVNTN